MEKYYLSVLASVIPLSDIKTIVGHRQAIFFLASAIFFAIERLFYFYRSEWFIIQK